MPTLDLKPNHAAVKRYYDALNQYGQLSISHENAVKTAFHDLLVNCGRKFQWVVVPEWKVKGPKGTTLSVDGALVDVFRLPRGFWEAKDSDDNLEKEIKKKFEDGYPKTNIIFQAPEKAILYQGGVRLGLNEDITDSANLVDLLKQFFGYREPHHEEWETAVEEFSDKIPQIAEGIREILQKERKSNPKFVASFTGFVALSRQAINPNLSEETVETMLIQHLLTERIFRKVFNNEQFTKRNIIAVEIEKVIDSLTSKHFSRDTFLQPLNSFYHAIEVNAENAMDYSEKQGFLNTVYERFFQGFSKKEADTHGIVYTPQAIVDFMVRSVEDILQKEFGKSLSDEGVHILDPFVGTGNFMVRVMKEIKSTKLRQKYENELHCNEIMLLPYYIASMNIEHEYLERMGEYKPFPGICMVDTFELAEAQQTHLFTAANTERVERQKRSPITVIIANPPYNAGQANENDNNKNRKYKELDKQIAATYGKNSRASNKNALTDPYVKAIRWASSRVGQNGIVAFISNNSFVRGISFDGLRRCLMRDFWKILHVNLKGDARTSAERRKQEGGNIFADTIRVSVGITFLVKKPFGVPGDAVSIYEADDYLGSNDKSSLLANAKSIFSLPLRELLLNDKGDWVFEDDEEEYSAYIAIGGKLSKATDVLSFERIFSSSSNGLKTNRDAWAYNQNREVLSKNIKTSSAFYNDEGLRWQRRSNKKQDLDQFVTYDAAKISWSRDLKLDLQRGREAEFRPERLRRALYRPFQNLWVYFDRLWNEEVYSLPSIFPDEASEAENRLLVLSDIGARAPYSTFLTNILPDLHLCSSDAFQCFPFYTYNEDGSNRQENITDWALGEFRTNYKDKKIAKWDIFHYTYGVLHDPEYRVRYAANLKRELPRIPYAPDFHAYAKAGKRLAEIHVEYEKQKPYKLAEKENKAAFTWRVEKMRLSKDKTQLTYNQQLTLSGIPPEVYEYRLGNRSALEWVVDQYQVSTDKRSGIMNDPNREDDQEYIYRLIGQVITVSLETVAIVKSLPGLGLPKLASAAVQ